MKKFIPFKKEMPFKSQVAEITSISLEHTIQKSGEFDISGDFIVSGEYKVTETSTSIQDFRFDLPFEVSMSDIYDINDVIISVDDFYYEVKNSEVLEVNITLLLDNIKERALIIDNDLNNDLERIENVNVLSEECYDDEDTQDDLTRDSIVSIDNIDTRDNTDITDFIDDGSVVGSNLDIFPFDDDDNECTYTVYIVREGDTVESILERYNISIDVLKEYNTIGDIKKGDKLIIPNV